MSDGPQMEKIAARQRYGAAEGWLETVTRVRPDGTPLSRPEYVPRSKNHCRICGQPMDFFEAIRGTCNACYALF